MNSNPHSKAWLFLLALTLLLAACSSTPDGFSAESWARLQRDNPNRARVVKWANGRPDIQRARKIYTKAWAVLYPAQNTQEAQGSINRELQDSVNQQFYDVAEKEQLQGSPGMTVKLIAHALRNMANRQRNQGTTLGNQNAVQIDGLVRELTGEAGPGPGTAPDHGATAPGTQAVPSANQPGPKSTPTPVQVRPTPAIYSWIVRATFIPIHTTIRGIPVGKINKDWELGSELMKEGVPKEHLQPKGVDEMEANGAHFSIEGDFDSSGVQQQAIVGVYQDKKGGKGSFLLILKNPTNPEVTFLHVIPNYTGFLCLTRRSEGIVLSSCYACGDVNLLRWNAKKNTFVFDP